MVDTRLSYPYIRRAARELLGLWPARNLRLALDYRSLEWNHIRLAAARRLAIAASGGSLLVRRGWTDGLFLLFDIVDWKEKRGRRRPGEPALWQVSCDFAVLRFGTRQNTK